MDTQNHQKPATSAQWPIAAVVFGVGFLAILWLKSGNKDVQPKNAEKSEAQRLSDSIATCRAAIRRAAKDPDSAEIPWVDPVADPSGRRHTFMWSQATQLMRLRNGLGLDVSQGGTCAIEDGRLVELVVAGEKLL